RPGVGAVVSLDDVGLDVVLGEPDQELALREVPEAVEAVTVGGHGPDDLVVVRAELTVGTGPDQLDLATLQRPVGGRVEPPVRPGLEPEAAADLTGAGDAEVDVQSGAVEGEGGLIGPDRD